MRGLLPPGVVDASGQGECQRQDGQLEQQQPPESDGQDLLEDGSPVHVDAIGRDVGLEEEWLPVGVAGGDVHFQELAPSGDPLGVAVLVTSFLRARIGMRVWRAVHWLAYGAWPLALLHSLGSGSDNHAPWMLVVDAVCIVPVAITVAWRSVSSRGSNRSALASVASPGRGG